MGTYYPTASTHWAFLESLAKTNNDTYLAAQKTFQEANVYLYRSMEGKGQSQAMVALDRLIQFERTKEKAFLSDCLKDASIPATPMGEGQLITAFNKLYQRRDIIRRNYDKLVKIQNQASSKSSFQRINLSQSFSSYLSKQIWETYKVNKDNMTADNLRECVKNALINMFQVAHDTIQTEEGEETVYAYKELGDILEKSADSQLAKDLINNVTSLYFKKGEEFITSVREAERAFSESKTKSGRRRKKTFNYTNIENKITSKSTKQGTLFEFIEQYMLNAFDVLNQTGMRGLHTGNLNAKPDNLLISLGIDIPDNEVLDLIGGTYDAENRSKRVQHIRGMKKLLERLQDAEGYIVEISDKSYAIGNEKSVFKGISLERPTIKNLGLTLEEFGQDGNTVEMLQFILMNVGEQMIADPEEAEIAIQYLTRLIAYFMFDDVAINASEDAKGVKTIHLFNIDEFYIPLSAILQGIYNAILQAEGAMNISNLVNISINADTKEAKYHYIEGHEATQEEWEAYAETRRNKVIIDIKFLQSFADYITRQININSI